MAPVRHKICALYVEKSTSSSDPKCASYILTQSYSNCHVCKSFAGLYNLLNTHKVHLPMVQPFAHIVGCFVFQFLARLGASIFFFILAVIFLIVALNFYFHRHQNRNLTPAESR
jgi:hypothetical protein